METRSTIIEEVNELLTRNFDAEQCFRNAAETMKDPDLQIYFNECSQDRYRFGHELKNEIARLGGDPEKGPVERNGLTWMNLRPKLENGNVREIIKECIHGDTRALQDYEFAIVNNDLPKPTEAVLSDHATAIRRRIIEIAAFQHRA